LRGLPLRGEVVLRIYRTFRGSVRETGHNNREAGRNREEAGRNSRDFDSAALRRGDDRGWFDTWLRGIPGPLRNGDGGPTMFGTTFRVARCAMSAFSHFDESGGSRMVDVGEKPVTVRVARASARVRMLAETGRLIRDQQMAKGDVLEVARLAGIQAAKRTWELIPLCHPLPLDAVELKLEFESDDLLAIEATARATARTGVEMEALTAAAVAALAVYDMCKAVDRGISIERIRLEEKSGGKSGHFTRNDA
jgi:cyclic pyranopterin phosphate synthase